MKKYVLGIALSSLFLTTNVFAEVCTKHVISENIYSNTEIWSCTTPEAICYYMNKPRADSGVSVSCIPNPHFQKTTK